MDLIIQLSTEQSKSNTSNILQWIGNDESRIQQLIKLFLSDDHRMVQQTSWLVSHLSERYPVLMETYLTDIIQRMTDDRQHVAVRRNMIRALQFISIPQILHGEVLDACFSFLENPKEGNVVRVFSMTVIGNMTIEYPELVPEFISIIEWNLDNKPSPAFKNRALKILHRLQKQNFNLA